MKKFFLCLAVTAILSACTKSTDTPAPGGGGGGITDVQAPSVPGNVSATATYFSVQLTWSPSTDNVSVSGYKILRNGIETGVSTTTNFTDNNVIPNTSYSYKVSAYDAAGNNSDQSGEFRITTLQADTASIMTGRWMLIKDSVSNVGNFYFVQGGTNYYPNGGVYPGTAADYWDFGTNGMLSLFENGNGFSNVPYHYAGNGRVFITQISAAYNDAFILQLNNTNFTLYWTNTSPNGGVYTRKLYLRK